MEVEFNKHLNIIRDDQLWIIDFVVKPSVKYDNKYFKSKIEAILSYSFLKSEFFRNNKRHGCHSPVFNL